jgi:putative acetyltransferase
MSSAPVMLIRKEEYEDWPVVHALNASVFETAAEAKLVDALRRDAKPIISLVAAEGKEIVGHILFSPVSLVDHPELMIMGLAPMAVAAHRQRRGIGSALVGAGLEHCKQLGAGAVVVLGHHDYYPRFGFVPATRYGLRSAYEVPEEAFMAVELRPGYLKDAGGMIEYHAAFGNL